MKSLATIIALFCLTVSTTTAADPPPISAVIVTLNQPGTITVSISVGSDDGVRPGDVFDVYRDKRKIGELTVADTHPDQSTARISDVLPKQKLQAGDHVLRDATLQFLRQLGSDSNLVSPAELGRKYAQTDLESDFPRILYCGRPWSAGKPLIDDETGYPVTITAGCVVTPEFVQFVDAYNATVRVAFRKR